MKKLGLLVIPLMTVSFLASCNQPTPTPVVDVVHNFHFIGTNCTINGESEYSHDIFEKDKNVQYTIVPYTGYKLPETIEGVEYNPSNGVITISEIKNDIELRVEATHIPQPGVTHTVTLDANGGSYITGSTYSFDVKEGDNLSKNIKAIVPPYLNEKTFAYYTYSDGTAIDYDDTVTSDIKLKANYFDITAPLTDLDSPRNISWKEIKAVATTNYNPSSCFKIGAIKKVNVNTKTHTVRIIGFNHDYSELPDDGSNLDPSKVLGITFEFANVITGNAVTTIWNGEYQKSGDNYDYRKSVLNTFLNNDVLNMLPSSSDPSNPNLKDVIKPVDKKVGVSTDGGQNYPATSFDGSEHPYPYLFPLAHDEITSETSTSAPANEGKIYKYYSEHSSQDDRIKRKAGTEGGNGESYWLRSPYTGNSNCACYCLFTGVLNYSGRVYNNAYAVAPAFCI